MATNLHALANPGRFRRIARAVMPWAAVLTGLLFASGAWFALFDSPADYQQGETVRIMYIHVPSAWVAMFGYAALAIASALFLIWKHPLAEVGAKAIAPVGACFTALTLATGSLWGKPIWGTWWVWDARLTSVLILLFLYLGYMALSSAFDDSGRGAKAASILALVGAVNLPVIKFSVDWWNTLHQPASVSRLDLPAVHPEMLAPLLLMAFAFKAYFVVVVILRMRAELAARRTRQMRMRQAETAATLG